jgi:hypothetical protein
MGVHLLLWSKKMCSNSRWRGSAESDRRAGVPHLEAITLRLAVKRAMHCGADADARCATLHVSDDGRNQKARSAEYASLHPGRAKAIRDQCIK